MLLIEAKIPSIGTDTFQKFIRRNEFTILNGLTSLGEVIKETLVNRYGKQFSRYGEDIFLNREGQLVAIKTGAGLCQLASMLILTLSEEKFGIKTGQIIWGPVDKIIPPNIYDDFKQGGTKSMKHARVWLLGEKGNWYFIDPTYAQINPRLPRIVIDEVQNEPYYYGFNKRMRDITVQKMVDHQEAMNSNGDYPPHRKYKSLFQSLMLL